MKRQGGGVIVNAPPFESGWLNSLKVLPAVIADPRFVTVIVPAPLLVSVPLTLTMSLVAPLMRIQLVARNAR